MPSRVRGDETSTTHRRGGHRAPAVVGLGRVRHRPTSGSTATAVILAVPVDESVMVAVAGVVNVGAFGPAMFTVTVAVPPWRSSTVMSNESEPPLNHADPAGVWCRHH